MQHSNMQHNKMQHSNIKHSQREMQHSKSNIADATANVTAAIAVTVTANANAPSAFRAWVRECVRVCMRANKFL